MSEVPLYPHHAARGCRVLEGKSVFVCVCVCVCVSVCESGRARERVCDGSLAKLTYFGTPLACLSMLP